METKLKVNVQFDGDNFNEMISKTIKETEENEFVKRVHKRFPLLLRKYPKIKWFDKFVILKVLKMQRHVFRGYMFYTYKSLFSNNRKLL